MQAVLRTDIIAKQIGRTRQWAALGVLCDPAILACSSCSLMMRGNPSVFLHYSALRTWAKTEIMHKNLHLPH